MTFKFPTLPTVDHVLGRLFTTVRDWRNPQALQPSPSYEYVHGGRSSDSYTKDQTPFFSLSRLLRIGE